MINIAIHRDKKEKGGREGGREGGRSKGETEPGKRQCMGRTKTALTFLFC